MAKIQSFCTFFVLFAKLNLIARATIATNPSRGRASKCRVQHDHEA